MSRPAKAPSSRRTPSEALSERITTLAEKIVTASNSLFPHLMSVIQQLDIDQNSSMIIGLYFMTSTAGHKQEIAA
jgi:hypothetical protein